MHAAAMALLLCLISSIAHAQPIIDLNKAMKCSDPQKVMKYFRDTHKETPVWVGNTVHNSYITLLTNPRTGSWTMIEYDNEMACVLGAGEDQSSSKPEI